MSPIPRLRRMGRSAVCDPTLLARSQRRPNMERVSPPSRCIDPITFGSVSAMLWMSPLGKLPDLTMPRAGLAERLHTPWAHGLRNHMRPMAQARRLLGAPCPGSTVTSGGHVGPRNALIVASLNGFRRLLEAQLSFCFLPRDTQSSDVECTKLDRMHGEFHEQS